MKSPRNIPNVIPVQIGRFLLHLRWHYQLFILSGGFLLGAFFSRELDFSRFVIQFLNVHLLLFGGATAFNSYWDRDEGPVGGLKNPPPMEPWMRGAALFLQLGGLLVALLSGVLFFAVYAFSMLLFWLYSTPWARWKGHPLKSLFVIGISTGFNAVLMGYLAAGNRSLSLLVIGAALGVTFILLSLYPVSQIYQMEEDQKRGDVTFSLHYGTLFVKRFFSLSFFPGLFITSAALIADHFPTGILFGVTGLITGFVIRSYLKKVSARKEDYHRVMNIKYGTSLAFVSFLVIVLFLKFVL